MVSLGDFLYQEQQTTRRTSNLTSSSPSSGIGGGSISSNSSSSNHHRRRRSSRQSYVRRGNCLGTTTTTTTTTTRGKSPLGRCRAAEDEDDANREDFLLLPHHQIGNKSLLMKDVSNQSNETEETCSVISDLDDDFSLHSQDDMDSSSFIDGGHCRFRPDESVSILDICEDNLREMDLENSEPDLLPPPGSSYMQRINKERTTTISHRRRRTTSNEDEDNNDEEEEDKLAKFIQDRLTLFSKNMNFLQGQLNASFAK